MQDKDSAYTFSVKVNGKSENIGRYRDVVRKTALGVEFVILSIENQQKIHYAMPIRTMLYDTLSYVGECRDTALAASDKLGWTVDEWLSKIPRGSTVTPCFTLCLYYGEKSWDGPKSLYDMMHINQRIVPFVQDYRLNLIEVGAGLNGKNFKTAELRELFQGLHEIYTTHPSSNTYHGTTMQLLGILTGSQSLYQLGESEEVIKMCNALKELENKGLEKGLEKGLAQNQINQLNIKLDELGRTDDIIRSAKDPAYQKQLLQEFGLLETDD